MESSGRQQDDKTQLVSSPQSVTGDRCMTFYYHMFGGHINTLNVYADTRLIWSRSTNQGNVWRKGSVTVAGSTLPYEVRDSVVCARGTFVSC